MRHYVCGFLFTPGEPYVALIKKQRPPWQTGLYNGIGGKVEDGEEPIEAMVREFHEETGATITSWKPFCTIIHSESKSNSGPWTVHFFKATEVATLQSITDEKVRWWNIAVITSEFSRGLRFVPNLRWLIPMAFEDVTAEVQQLNWVHDN